VFIYGLGIGTKLLGYGNRMADKGQRPILLQASERGEV
jgi:hypothetical protein